MLASVPLIPKFASEVTAMACELRNRDTSRSPHHNAPARDPATHSSTHAWRCRMSLLRSLALLFTLAFLCAPAHAQDGKIAIEKFNHSEWTKGIFSEVVTVTGIGNA